MCITNNIEDNIAENREQGLLSVYEDRGCFSLKRKRESFMEEISLHWILDKGWNLLVEMQEMGILVRMNSNG